MILMIISILFIKEVRILVTQTYNDKRYSIVEATFLPDGDLMRNLKAKAFPSIGETCYFQYAWVIEKEDGTGYEGEYACMPIFIGEYKDDLDKWPFSWIPESSLDVIRVLSREEKSKLSEKKET